MDISHKPISKSAIIVVSLAALFYVYEFGVRVLPEAMTVELMRHFSVTAKGLGVIASLFFYGYASLQIPSGMLIDRFGPKRLLVIGALFAGTFTFLFIATHHATLGGFSRLMIGIGSSVAYIATLVLTARWFASKYFAFIAGSVQLLGAIGAILGLAPVAVISETAGWKHTIYIVGSIGIALAILFWCFIKNHPEDYKVEKSSTNFSQIQSLKKLFRSSHTWWIGCIAFSAWAPVSVFASLWGVPTITAIYHVSNVSASNLTAIFWLGIGAASPLVGWWSDKIEKRKTPMIICATIGIITPLFFLYFPHLNLFILGGLLFIYGFAAANQILSFALVQDNTPHDLVGTAVGINNMAAVLGGVILQPLVGFILNAHWSGKMIYNIPIYSAMDYQVALILLPICSVIGLLVTLFFIKETRCKRQY